MAFDSSENNPKETPPGVVGVQLSAEQTILINRVASELGLTRNEFIRRTAFNAAVGYVNIFGSKDQEKNFRDWICRYLDIIKKAIEIHPDTSGYPFSAFFINLMAMKELGNVWFDLVLREEIQKQQGGIDFIRPLALELPGNRKISD